jgi:hypothetical protein
MSADDHDIQREPHLAGTHFSVDPSETDVAARLEHERLESTEADAVEHTVWSEPALAAELTGLPDQQQVTYPRWLQKKISATSWPKSLGAMLLVAVAGGPWSLLSALVAGVGGGSVFSVLMITVFGPVSEEIAKVAAALWVVEKRPYLFKSIWQIFLCAGCAGLVFSVLENLIYIYVYVPQHTAEFVHFRWTVCLFLHISCSLVTAVGLARIWDNAIRNLHPPRLALGVPWFVIAMAGHGLFNLSVMVATSAGWLDLGMPQSLPE